MPTTRSQAADDKAAKLFEDSPASPSENAPASTVNPRSTEPTASEIPRPVTISASRPTAEPMRTRAPSIRSQRSTASAIARIRQAELDAEEQLAEIRRQELQIQATLIKKKLAVDVATIREETDRESIGAEEVEDTDRRISEWLQRSHIRGEREPTTAEAGRQRSPPPRETGLERRPMETPNRVAFEAARRQPSPTPGRSRERGIERLADTLEKMTRNRGPTRQMQELPIFSGAPGEWLPFKAAMRESSQLYGYTPTENLARLRTCLRGEARQTVSALLYTATEPSIIMKTLEQCYGRPEIIIDQAFEEIKKLPRLGTTAAELNTFAIKLQNIVTVITCLDEKGYLQNPMMTRQVTEKLSPHIKSKWCDYAEENGNREEPEIVTLSRFLMREADRAVRHSYTNSITQYTARPSREETKGKAYNEKRRIFNTTDTAVKKKVCFCCGGEHSTPQCKKLEAMSVSKRWEWAKEARICFLCLDNKHRRFKCRNKKCGVNECRMQHHALLHWEREKEKIPTEENAITASTHTSTADQEVLLKVCPITIRHGEMEIETYALLDEGSTISLIDERTAAAIGAHGPKKAINIHSVTSSQSEPDSRVVEIAVRGKDTDREYNIKARTVKNLQLGRQTIKRKHLNNSHLKGLREERVCYADAKPRILIGADQWHLIVTRRLLTGKRNQPAASLTRLGWVIHGAAPRSVIQENGENVLHIRMQEKDDLDELVKYHFDVDALGIIAKRRPRPEEERAIQIFNNTVKHVEGHYEVGLPWSQDNASMPPSYDMALKRLRSIEKKLDKNPKFKKAYTEQVEKLIQKGYAAPCNQNHEKEHRLWYLPHFATTNPNKPNKIRMVFDAAAVTNGICLNDALLDGPDLLQGLPGILFRFRTKPIAVTADIREMFLRIKIRKEDRIAQHFLWRGDDRINAPKRYVMTSMIFGARSSPFLAHSVRNLNAKKHEKSHPLAYVAITRDHYMDDWLGSFDSEEIASRAINEVTEIHGKGGFQLAGWSSNKKDLLENTPEEILATGAVELNTKGDIYGRTLGIIWDASEDLLSFNTTMPRIPEEVRKGNRIPTKREALAAVMSIFDPLGLLSPFTVSAKIMIQGLWRRKMGWDEQLPFEEARMFEEWVEDIKWIKQIKIPRCYNENAKKTRHQLHIFCDASEQAYAAVAYWRLELKDGSTKTAIIAGKAKVAPMKTQSIPRLELQAALIGTRLGKEIINEHEINADVIYWSDSKTVLHWIRNGSNKYTPYVAHRLSEIAENSSPEQWRWIPTSQNVADDATRAGNTRLTNDSRWFTGPEFLKEPEYKWHQEEMGAQELQEENIMYVTEETPLIEIKRFSQYKRLVRATAYVLLFIEKCKDKTKELEHRHIREAEKILIRIAQKECFGEEIRRLSEGKIIDKASKLYKLDPKLGEDGIIRLHGRINAAAVPERLKEPPILDGKHHLTQLIINEVHRNTCHAGREQTVNTIRQELWVIRLRPAVRKVIANCVKCKIVKSQPKIPVKGDLPRSRLQAYERPFSQCGLDFFGPMWVTIGRRKEKRWGVLFTCMVTRAIHLEVSASLSTDSAIMALRRMAARRGWPQQITSDNATNFRGACMELKEAYKEWIPELKNFALLKRIDWHFIDPGAPNQGGAWERLIRSVKTALNAVLQERTPKEETLTTLLAEIEHTVNSRPLTHVPVNPEDPEALTPNHFLLGSAVGLPQTGYCGTADKKAWRATQALADMFWARWMREYLSTLSPRDDVQKHPKNISEGDIVVITDNTLPRNTWPKGIVTSIFRGPDEIVRSVEVATRGGVFRRPVRRLVVLQREEVSENPRRGETVADNERQGPDRIIT